MKCYTILAMFILLPSTIFFPIKSIDEPQTPSPHTLQRSFLPTTPKPEIKRKSIDEQAHDMLKAQRRLEAQEKSWPNILKQSLNPFNSINIVIFDIIPALYFKLKKSSHKLSKWWSAYAKRFSY